jgi:hypothetical protein
LVITKAFEKSGEKLGEKAIEKGGKLVRLLQERFPKTASALVRVQEHQQDWREAELEVEAAARQDEDVKATVEAISDEVKSQPTFKQMIKNIVKNNYGGNVGNVQNDNRTQNFNF